MSHTLANGEIIEVTAVVNLLGQYSMNVYNMQLSGSVGASVTDQEFLTDMDATLAPLYKLFLSTSSIYHGTKVQVVHDTRYDPITSIASQGPGSLAGDLLPTQTAGLVKWKTGLANRRKMGRTYFPATSEGENTASAKPGAGYLGGVNALALALQIGGTVAVGGRSIDWKLVVWSKNFDIITPVNSYVVRTDWATMRKRSHIGRPDTAPF